MIDTEAREIAVEILGKKLDILEEAGLMVVFKSKEKNEQLALFDLDPALEIVQRVDEELRDYHWMVKEVERIRGYLEGAGEGTVRQYGIDSALPKPRGGNTDPVHREVARRERQWNRLQRLEDKVRRIEAAVEKIKDDKKRTMVECIMDGLQMKNIARHVGVSRQRLNEMRREVLKFLAWEMYGDELKAG